jgi:hypothetical protein
MEHTCFIETNRSKTKKLYQGEIIMAVTPRKTTNAKTDAAGRRVKTAGEGALASYAEKTITPVMQDFADFLTSQTGYKVDPMSVQLGSALRGTFQKSQFNQDRIATRAQEREAEATAKLQRAADREAARVAKEQEKADRAASKEAAAAAKAAAPKPEKAAKAPAKAAATKATKAPAKSAKVTPLASRRRPASSSTKQSDF